MIENDPTDLERAKIERTVGNQYNKLLNQQQDSKTLSALKGTTKAGRGEKKRGPCNRFEGTCFNCGRKSHRAEDCRSVKKKISKSGDTAADKKGGSRGKRYVFGRSVGVRSTLHTSTVACADVLSTGLAIVRSEKQRRA